MSVNKLIPICYSFVFEDYLGDQLSGKMYFQTNADNREFTVVQAQKIGINDINVKH